jgi:hypothetical protein
MDAEGVRPPQGAAMPPMMQQMMERMMTAMHESGPMAVCRAIMTCAAIPEDTSADAPPEVRALFEEWARTVEGELLAVLRARGPLDIAELAAALKLSPESTLHFLGKLVREGKATLAGTRASSRA